MEIYRSLPTDPIDRHAPTLRPAGWPVMKQNWRHLLFLHWTAPVDQLRALVPPELEIDTFDGRAYIGLVPFTMLGVRPVGVPALPGLSRFHETNVRTYVHFRGRDPGVWFFSLDAANALAVRVARALFKLPYHFARMRLDLLNSATGARESKSSSDTLPGSITRIDYATDRLWPGPTPAACAVRYRVEGPVMPALSGTLEHFLAERYILYTTSRGGLVSGRVHHMPYPLQSAVVESLDENMIEAAGITRGPDAPLAHYAWGVNVDIYPLQAAV